MPRFASYDGTEIAYRVLGDGPPLVCLPGGPGRAVEYLGDLGGLDKARRLVLLDLRGVGASAAPADPATYRVDRLVSDVESLRAHLGLQRMDLLAHSAGGVLATLYAAAHPERLARLLLITPGLGPVGVDFTAGEFTAVIERRAAQPWYPAARAAGEKIDAGDRSMETYLASRPLLYGRWDEAAQAHAGVGVSERHAAARYGFFRGLQLDVVAVKAGLQKLTAPVLLYAGDRDPLVTPAMVREAAPVFAEATVIVQPGAGHFPWVDDPAAFATAIASFLGRDLPMLAPSRATQVRDLLVVVLALTTGAIDAVTFLRLGTVFSSVITGNLALLGVAAGEHNGSLAVSGGLALAGYALGVLLGGALAGVPEKGQPVWPRPATVTLALELVVLAGFSQPGPQCR